MQAGAARLDPALGQDQAQKRLSPRLARAPTAGPPDHRPCCAITRSICTPKAPSATLPPRLPVCVCACFPRLLHSRDQHCFPPPQRRQDLPHLIAPCVRPAERNPLQCTVMQCTVRPSWLPAGTVCPPHSCTLWLVLERPAPSQPGPSRGRAPAWQTQPCLQTLVPSRPAAQPSQQGGQVARPHNMCPAATH